MANAKVSWKGSRTFIGTDSTQHAVIMSNKEDGIGMKASELMLVALATCSSFDVVGILEKRKVNLRKLDVEVSAKQEPEPPWTFTDIHLKYILAGNGLEPKHAETAIRLSEEKYCSVAATLKGKANITWEYVIET
jgi:putative redox protein